MHLVEFINWKLQTYTSIYLFVKISNLYNSYDLYRKKIIIFNSRTQPFASIQSLIGDKRIQVKNTYTYLRV